MATMDWQVHVVVALGDPISDTQLNGVAEDLERSTNGAIALSGDRMTLEATMTGRSMINTGHPDDGLGLAVAGVLASLRYALDDSHLNWAILTTDTRRSDPVDSVAV